VAQPRNCTRGGATALPSFHRRRCRNQGHGRRLNALMVHTLQETAARPSAGVGHARLVALAGAAPPCTPGRWDEIPAPGRPLTSSATWGCCCRPAVALQGGQTLPSPRLSCGHFCSRPLASRQRVWHVRPPRRTDAATGGVADGTPHSPHPHHPACVHPAPRGVVSVVAVVAVFDAATAVAPGVATARDEVVATVGASQRPAAGGLFTRAGSHLTDDVLAGGALYHSCLGHLLYGSIGLPPWDPPQLAPKEVVHLQPRSWSGKK